MINNIKNNTTSEAFAKQKLDELNEIKKTEIINKCLISSKKKLLNLFDELLVTTFNNKNNNYNYLSMNVNDNISVNVNYNDVNDFNDVNDVNGDDDVNNDENDDDDDDDDDSDDDNKDEDYYILKQLNNYFKTIDETKSFKE